MSEWWTYSLSDFLLFAPRTYYRLFELYNAAIWPTHVAALALAIAIALALVQARRGPGRLVFLGLAGAWLWVGWAYHLRHYATINWAAEYFAAGFAVEALLLGAVALAGGGIDPAWQESRTAPLGAGLFAFAVLVEPLIGALTGRPWLQAEVFAIAPDPTAIATLGLALTAGGRASWLIVPIPLAWCALSGATLWAMGSPEFIVMPAAIGVAALAGWLKRRPIARR